MRSYRFISVASVDCRAIALALFIKMSIPPNLSEWRRKNNSRYADLTSSNDLYTFSTAFCTASRIWFSSLKWAKLFQLKKNQNVWRKTNLTSTTQARHFPPASSTSLTTVYIVPGNFGCGLSVLAAITTLAPSLAAFSAIALPIPREAPVMKMVKPRRFLESHRFNSLQWNWIDRKFHSYGLLLHRAAIVSRKLN